MSARELEHAEQSERSRLLQAQPHVLHPAGGIYENFVYEPISAREYVWATIEGHKGISQKQTEYEDDEHQKRPHFSINIDGQRYYFSRSPPLGWIFNLPNRDAVDSWVYGQKTSLNLTDLWKLNRVFLQTFIDLPKVYEYDTALLFISESWLIDLLNVVFYADCEGAFGGGKTVLAEALSHVCKHGYLTGNLSPSFIARATEEQKITLMVDELDSVAGTKDSDLNSIFRQGYRRGTKYSRVNPDSLMIETFEIFGCKFFTVHDEAEQALQTRTVPHHTRETIDAAYPIIGSDKLSFARDVYTENFLWYMDNILLLRDSATNMFSGSNGLFDTLDQLNLKIGDPDISEHPKKIRAWLFSERKRALKNNQVEQVCQVSGRNTELMYLCFALADTIGVNCDDSIVQAFAQKQIEEGERTELGYLGILKDVLATKYSEKKAFNAKLRMSYTTSDGLIKISNKELYDTLNEKLKQEVGQGVSPATFKGYMTEFGFTDGLNRIKLEVPIPSDKPDDDPTSRLCNIFTGHVLRKLGIEEKEQHHGNNDGSYKAEGSAEEPCKLNDLTSVYFTQDRAKKLCGVCGYEKETSWETITVKSQTIAICEDCAQQFAKERDKA